MLGGLQTYSTAKDCSCGMEDFKMTNQMKILKNMHDHYYHQSEFMGILFSICTVKKVWC